MIATKPKVGRKAKHYVDPKTGKQIFGLGRDAKSGRWRLIGTNKFFREDDPAKAIARFLKFMAAHNYDWARTGHIPAFKSVLNDKRFMSLPHRADIAPIAAIGRPLPSYVQRQNAIEGIVGEEGVAAFTGQKSIRQALAAAERRVNDMLVQVD